jgi:hypothetical protein
LRGRFGSQFPWQRLIGDADRHHLCGCGDTSNWAVAGIGASAITHRPYSLRLNSIEPLGIRKLAGRWNT